MEKLRDPEIRSVLIEKLALQYCKDPDTKIINEMNVCQGQSRVDIAVLNGIMHGFEIKSESDKLIRLPSQINDYNKVFERMTIVTADDYLEKVRDIVPSWWGIIKVVNKNGKAKLISIKKGKVNPTLDSVALVQLLWKDEVLKLLKEKGLDKGYLTKPRRVLYDRLVKNISITELKLKVNEYLKVRQGWRDR